VDFFNHYLQIVLLGIVEGVTEFLPISSTGHLLIAEQLGLGHEPDVFNVVIQAGAILAVVFIYWHKIMDLIGSLDKAESRNYLLKVILAFAVTSVVSLLLIKHYHIKLPETLTPVAWATLIGGFVIFAIEFLAKNLYPHEEVSWFEAALMGLAQVVAAVFPGASRSGSTIMTGMAMGMKRPAATQFSFLLGIPTMFAASGLDIWRYRKDLTTADHQLVLDIIVGFLVSMVVAFFVVKWLLRFVQSHTFNGFAIYRVILGMVLLAALATHAIPEGGDASAKAETAKAGAAKVESAPTLAPQAREAPLPVMDTNSPSTLMPASTPTTKPAQLEPITVPGDSTDGMPATTNAAPTPVAPATNGAYVFPAAPNVYTSGLDKVYGVLTPAANNPPGSLSLPSVNLSTDDMSAAQQSRDEFRSGTDIAYGRPQALLSNQQGFPQVNTFTNAAPVAPNGMNWANGDSRYIGSIDRSDGEIVLTPDMINQPVVNLSKPSANVACAAPATNAESAPIAPGTAGQ